MRVSAVKFDHKQSVMCMYTSVTRQEGSHGLSQRLARLCNEGSRDEQRVCHGALGHLGFGP